MKRLGVGGYRFSISWPRIQPTGRGPANAAGARLLRPAVDGCSRPASQPMATLYHWDLPQALEDDGGWLNRDTIDRFAEYAAIVASGSPTGSSTGSRSTSPTSSTLMGYGDRHARAGPARCCSTRCRSPTTCCSPTAGPRSRCAPPGATSVGCANNHAPMWPASDDDADVGATKLFDALWNGMFLEPMLLGRYPADLTPLLEDVVQPGDLATIRQPLDFYGVNYYNPMQDRRRGRGRGRCRSSSVELLGYPTTDFGWPVVPDALREWLIMFRARYRAALPPIVITESGCVLRHGPGRGRRRRRPAAHRLPRRPPARRRRRPCSAASTSAATTRGR